MVRLGDVYDFESLAISRINSSFHGLGHSGWDLWCDRKNPTHIIRFREDQSGERIKLLWLWPRLFPTKPRNPDPRVRMEYKLIESDLEWRPRFRFDSSTRQWIESLHVRYHLISEECSSLIRTPDIIRAKLPTTTEWQKIKKGVHGCAASASRCWTSEDTKSWESFFNNPTYPNLSPFMTADYWSDPSRDHDSSAHISLPLPSPSTNQQLLLTCPEPLVCESPAAATAWSQSRRRTPVSAPQSEVHLNENRDAHDLCESDVVVIIPDDNSRDQDVEAGYTLPISFGRIVAVNDVSVKLEWLFSTSIDAKFSLWVIGGQPVRDIVDISVLQRSVDGSVLKMKFTSAKKLTAASRVLLEPILSEIGS